MMLVLARTANNLCQNDPLKQLKVDPKQKHPWLPRQPIKTGPTERKLQIQRSCISIIDADGERTDSRGLRERINVKFSCGSQNTRKHSRSGKLGARPKSDLGFHPRWPWDDKPRCLFVCVAVTANYNKVLREKQTMQIARLISAYLSIIKKTRREKNNEGGRERWVS